MNLRLTWAKWGSLHMRLSSISSKIKVNSSKLASHSSIFGLQSYEIITFWKWQSDFPGYTPLLGTILTIFNLQSINFCVKMFSSMIRPLISNLHENTQCYLRYRWSHCIQTRCANLLFTCTMIWFSAIIILHGPNSSSFIFSYLRDNIITLRNMSDMRYNLVIFDPTFRYSPNTHHPVHVWVIA